MAVSQKGKFTFTWQIQNFSMSPSKFKEEVMSPVFVVWTLDHSEWQLALYPKGSDTENSVSCYLHCTSVGSNANVIQIGYSLLISSDDVKKQVTKKVKNRLFNKDDDWGFDMISRDAILKDKDAYLRNDTLTIKCSLWRYEDGDLKKDPSSNNLQSELLATALEDYTRDFGQWDECTVVTRVVVQSKKLFWPIKSFSSINFDKRLSLLVPSALKNVPSLFITFYKSSANQSVEIEICREKTDLSTTVFFMCKVSVLHTSKGAAIFAEDKHLFESDVDSTWKFPSFIKLNKLEEDKYFNRTCDVLHLCFEFSFSQPEDIHHTETVFILPNRTPVNLSHHPIEEFKQLYEDRELSDMTIRVGNQEFKAHKTILRARSPVFRAMLDNDMKEKESGVIDITDVDPDTVDKMLAFMYTNAVGDILAEEALELHSVADKYQILPLKLRCAWILASKLSVSNVCGVLSQADQHNDEYLRDCAEGFIQANSVAIFKSQEWADLIQNNGTVAATVMHKILTN